MAWEIYQHIRSIEQPATGDPVRIIEAVTAGAGLRARLGAGPQDVIFTTIARLTPHEKFDPLPIYLGGGLLLLLNLIFLQVLAPMLNVSQGLSLIHI